MHRTILAVIVLKLVTASSAAAQLAGEPAPPPASPGFIPSEYITGLDSFNCSNFVSQADAQAVLRADPSDPNQLDTDIDGLACESNRAPLDTVRVPR